MIEQWRDIPGFEGLYRVSDEGQIRRVKGNRREKNLKGSLNNRGYYYVKLWKDGSGFTVPVHRIVLITFSPLPHMDLLVVNHLNGDKTDNRLVNLVWTTQRGNADHYYEVLNKAQQAGSIFTEKFINVSAVITGIDQTSGTVAFQSIDGLFPVKLGQGMHCLLTVHLYETAEVQS